MKQELKEGPAGGGTVVLVALCASFASQQGAGCALVHGAERAHLSMLDCGRSPRSQWLSSAESARSWRG